MRNQEKDAREMAARHRKFMETGFRLFSENGIERVSLEQVARESGIGVATLYNYYGNKVNMVIAISAWKWEEYRRSLPGPPGAETGEFTGARGFAFYLDSFLELYRNHGDLLRFNQFFNIFLQCHGTDPETVSPLSQVIARFGERFRAMWETGAKDGTLKASEPWQKAFSTTMHLMMAAITRYSVGLAYTEDTEPEKELELMKKMLLKEYVVSKEP